MKKPLAFVMSLLMAVTLTACASGSEKTTQETIKIKSLNADKELVELEVPYDPERIAVLDMAALDILDNLELGDRVVGSASTSLEYLQSYVNDENVKNLGTIKEADLEAVMESDPDIIFIGGRLSASYDALSEIAPVVYLATDAEAGLVSSTNDNAATMASIFGKESDVASKMEGFTKRIEALKEVAEGKTAVIGMATSGSFNLLGNDGRCAMIATEIGFDNIGESAASSGGKGNKGSSENSSTSTHGNETSFELIVKLNPDYMFVLDRDAAIGSEGAQLAKDIVENELTMKTAAYENNTIVYLEHPAVWYTAEGGITALDVMLQDLEAVLLK